MDPCRELFKTMEILLFYFQHIFSLLMYVVKNKHLFTNTLDVYEKDISSAIKSANVFHLHFTNLNKYQKKELII